MGLKNHQLKKGFQSLRAGLQVRIEKEQKPLKEKGAEQRIKKAKGCLLTFITTYLPHAAGMPFSLFHQEVSTLLKPLTKNEAEGVKIALAAPRGNGKTTLLKALVLYLVAFEKKKFILWISDSLDQAGQSLESIQRELEENPRLAQDFPHIMGLGETWTKAEIITNNDIKIKAAGTGKRLRGMSFGHHRPDLVILDDLENDLQVQSQEQREKAYNWLFTSVLPLGPPEGRMDVLLVGTILHYDSVLARVLKHPSFAAKKFQAICNWPVNLHLWEKLEDLYHNESKEVAEEFYHSHEAQLMEGAKCLWPEAQPLYSLMIKRFTNRQSFDSEYQNEPIHERDRIFEEPKLYEVLPEGLTYFGSVDPSLGLKNKHSDPSAIVILGRDIKGKYYVAEALIHKIKPTDIIERVIELQEKYQCQKWAIEEVQFQAFFKEILLERALEQGTPIPAIGVKPTTDKRLRIEALQPQVRNGVILFHKSQGLLLDQLKYFPQADHDDGPDALEMAFQIGIQQKPLNIQSHSPQSWGQPQRFEGY